MSEDAPGRVKCPYFIYLVNEIWASVVKRFQTGKLRHIFFLKQDFKITQQKVSKNFIIPRKNIVPRLELALLESQNNKWSRPIAPIICFSINSYCSKFSLEKTAIKLFISKSVTRKICLKSTQLKYSENKLD